jgi:uncharacterized protein YndB with AHSA1/START domain
MNTDRIEKKIVMKAPLSRVWRAVSDSAEFGSWFQVKLDGPFVPGARVRGEHTYPGHEDWRSEMMVERVEPERLISFRWRGWQAKPEGDVESDPARLVEFHLAAVEGGTELTVIESGFDQLPLERRAMALRGNEEGWEIQLKAVERYVTA